MNRLYKLLLIAFICLLSTNSYSAEPKADKIRTDTTNFNNTLNTSDDNVQKALDKLENVTASGHAAVTVTNSTTVGITLSGQDLTPALLGFTGFTTNDLTESGNLYFTDVRARLAISNGTGISYNNTTGVINSTITQYTDALARTAINETITGIDYNATSGNFTLTSGYIIPTSTEETNWNTTYIWGNHSLAGYLTSLTPWTSNIDGAGYNLTNVTAVGIGTTSPGAALDVFPGTLATDIGISVKQTYTSGTSFQSLFQVKDSADNKIFGISVRGTDRAALTDVGGLRTVSGRDIYGMTFTTSANTAQGITAKFIMLESLFPADVSGYSANTIYGGKDSGDNLTIESTVHATKGKIYLNPTGGNVGIGTTGPDAKLDVLSTTEQLRLTYADGTNYSSFTQDVNGDLKITATGGDISFDNENLLTTGTLSAGAITGTSFTIGANTLDTNEWANLDGIITKTGTGALVLGTSPTFTTKIISPEVENAGNITIDAVNAIAASTVSVTNSDATYTANLSIEGDLTVTGGDITLGTSAIFSGGDTTSLNLIDAIDATTETTLETALDIGGEVTSTGMGSTVIADSIAVTSWALTTPTITTSVAINADPADTGAIRLSNADYIWAEASPAGTDISVLGVDATEVVQIAASGASGVTITPAVTASTSIISPIHSSNNADPADAGIIRLGNAESIAWEASPAGTDITLTVDSTEVLTTNGSIATTATGDSYFNEQVAIGQTSAAYLLDILGADNTTIMRIKNNANQAATTAADIFISFDSTTGVEANIAGTAVAGVVAYNTATLSHFSQLIDRDKAQPNMLLEVIEGKPEFGEGASPKQQLFKTRICRTKKSQAAMGTYGGTDIYGHDFVLSAGTGFVFVKNTGRNIKIGDLFYSSDSAGLVEFQNDTIIHNYTIAKATESIKWQRGEKQRLISCILLGG